MELEKNLQSKSVLKMGLTFFVFFFIVNGNFINANSNKVILYFFYGKGCPHCAKMEPFVDNLQEKYSFLEVKKFEVYFNDSNRNLFENISKKYGKKFLGVPAIFINQSVFVGYSPSVLENIDKKINECAETFCFSPELANVSTSYEYYSYKNGLIIFFVFIFVLLIFSFYLIKKRFNKK